MKRGFTLIELLVVISIIALLSSVVLSSINAARERARFTTTFAQMRQIEIAAQSYFLATGNQHTDLGPGSGGSMVPTHLSRWPSPPCSGWTYDWENWNPGTGFIGVTLRNSTVSPVHYLCTDKTSVCSGGAGTDITGVTDRRLVCN